MIPLTVERARVACREWQARLRLQDWDITIQVVRAVDMGRDNLGEIHTHATKRRAKINLLHPRDEPQAHQTLDQKSWDWELTLVHELLHLHMEDTHPKGWPGDESQEGLAYERAIHAMAQAFIALHRKPKRS